MSGRPALRRACLALLLLAACRSGPAPRVFDAGRLGPVRLFRPTGEPHAFVFLFSDAPGWSAELERTAAILADRGAAVAGVDLGEYLSRLAASHDGCHYLLSELEELSQRLQRQIGFERYRSPILAGAGAGGTLAYAALAQSPPATLAGAVSIDPAPSLATKVPLCEGAPASPAPGGGFRYGPHPGLPGWWRVVAREPLPSGLAADIAADGKAQRVEPQEADPGERLLAALGPELAVAASDISSRGLADLPLTELPSARPGPLFAVIYSGDGGWRDLDKQIGEWLAKSGIPTVGVDSLRYFWRAKTPEQMALDLARIIGHYGTEWRTQGVVLVGYSFGADTLPFAANRLPQRERAQVVQLSLLGLSSAADFEIHVSDWLGTGPRADALPVVPELRQLDPSRIQCFYGEQEDDTLCTAPALATAELIRTGGGHHFDGDYTALAAKILAGARRRSATESSSRAQDAAVLPPRPTGSTTRAQPPAMSAATSPVIRGHSQARR